jgi:hypothetical protein
MKDKIEEMIDDLDELWGEFSLTEKQEDIVLKMKELLKSLAPSK